MKANITFAPREENIHSSRQRDISRYPLHYDQTKTTTLFLTLLPQPLLIVLLQLLVDLGSLRGLMAVQRRLHSSAFRHYVANRDGNIPEQWDPSCSALPHSRMASYGWGAVPPKRAYWQSSVHPLLSLARLIPDQAGCLTGFGRRTYSNASCCGFRSCLRGTVPAR